MVAVEQPRRMRRGPQGSVGAGGHGGSNSGGGGIHRRMNAIKGGHNQTNHSGHHGGTYRLPNTPHDKMGKQIISAYYGFFLNAQPSQIPQIKVMFLEKILESIMGQIIYFIRRRSPVE